MADLKFEHALSRLEEIVEELESESIGLEESLKLYEEGVKLTRVCSTKLDSAQKKVELLVKQQDGNFSIQEFDEMQAQEVPQKKVKKKKATSNKDKDEGRLF